MPHRRTINRFIIEEQRKVPGATGELSALLTDLFSAFKAIGAAISRGAALAAAAEGAACDAHGAGGTALVELANQILLRRCEWGGQLAAMVSAALDDVYLVPDEYPRGGYLLLFHPLDGSSNLDVNLSAGSIFSILRRPEPSDRPPSADDFLQAGARQVCAGYAIYGPATMVVLTFGGRVYGFTLDREAGELLLVHPDIRIPDGTRELGIDAAHERFWEPHIKRYVSECISGTSGPRRADFNLRWVASLVADLHRVLMRGGLFLYPRDCRAEGCAGQLRLLYEANPMAFIVEAAGGAASTGVGRVLERTPRGIHDRVPLILGAKSEVERIERYHREHADGTDEPYRSPLFGTRSLFME